MRGHVVGDVLVLDPHPTELRLAAEDNGPRLSRGGGPVVVVTDGQIDLDAGPGSLGLPAEVVAEMPGVLPGVAVNIDDHDESRSKAANQARLPRVGSLENDT